jgi:hypothetical protein
MIRQHHVNARKMADLCKYKGTNENGTRLKYEVLRRSYGTNISQDAKIYRSVLRLTGSI